jgi:TonB family protein
LLRLFVIATLLILGGLLLFTKDLQLGQDIPPTAPVAERQKAKTDKDIEDLDSEFPLEENPQENQAQFGTLVARPSDEFQSLVENTLKLHQRFLEKCLIKLYEKKQGQLQGGEVQTRFTINKKGRIADVRVVESEFDDRDFHLCVEEVLSRVQFKAYKGPERTVDFPIRIELPH